MADVAWEADLERRFGGLRRLFGDEGYERLRAAHVVVVGVGGVGSWAAEALARSGVAALTLIDLDHVSESNVNRQIQALDATLGQAKVEALKERIAQIHPGCAVRCIEEFVDETNWPALLDQAWGQAWESSEGRVASPAVDSGEAAFNRVDAIIDACDQVRAKAAIAGWALKAGVPAVFSGAAGGKRRPQRVECDDLSRVTHDPLLASLRQRLRKHHGAPRTGDFGLRCVFSREPVTAPAEAACAPGDAPSASGNDGTLNCHGYGSSVTVTATFGLVAAAEAIESIVAPLRAAKRGASATRTAQDEENLPQVLSIER